MKSANNILQSCQPLVAFVALLFGVITAWKGLVEVFPIIGQVLQLPIKNSGSAQSTATVAGALALVVLALGGKGKAS